MRRTIRFLVLGALLAGILFVFLSPARTWMSQQKSLTAAQRQLSALSTENAALTKRVGQLEDPAYIEQTARAQFGLVKPGQKAFGILLPTATTTTLPATVKTNSGKHHSFWRDLEFWK